MKLLLTLSLLIVSSIGVAACNAHHNGHGPNHCPPGHAKKGWCYNG